MEMASTVRTWKCYTGMIPVVKTSSLDLCTKLTCAGCKIGKTSVIWMDAVYKSMTNNRQQNVFVRKLVQ